MSLCPKCAGQYRVSKDLVYYDPGSLQSKLSDLPAAAKGNFPVLSQGFFKLPNNYRKTALVTIKIRVFL